MALMRKGMIATAFRYAVAADVIATQSGDHTCAPGAMLVIGKRISVAVNFAQV